MKEFREIVTDTAAVVRQLAELDALLKSKVSLSERQDIQPFFKARDQISAFLGTYESEVGPATHLAYELPFLGDFAADVVVGNRANRQYVVVELEDGTPESVFTKVKGKKTKEWSKRFDHGYSQLIDWFCCLDDYRPTAKFIDEFGSGYVTFSGLLVIGRTTGMSDQERRRLAWRSKNVIVHSQRITCVTFDDLTVSLRARLGIYLGLPHGSQKPLAPRAP
jgi:hypothetical protein